MQFKKSMIIIIFLGCFYFWVENKGKKEVFFKKKLSVFKDALKWKRNYV
jgi:hypothetical protein